MKKNNDARRLPSWYPDWDDLKATNYMRPSGFVVIAIVALLLLLKGAILPALVIVAFGGISWFAIGRRSEK